MIGHPPGPSPVVRERPPAEPGAGRRRLFLLVAAGLVAFLAGALAGARHEPEEVRLARDYGLAWELGDWRAMHNLLSPAARRRTPLARFARAHEQAETTATALTRVATSTRGSDGEAVLELEVATRAFGRVAGPVRLPVVDDGGRRGVQWAAHHVFPGLRAGERLRRSTRLAPRAALLARDGTPLAAGPARTSPLGPAAADVAGRVGPAPPERAAALAARGVPDAAPVGLVGLERHFDAELTGVPGGVLLAGERALARSQPVPGRDVTTTIDPGLQVAAVTALAGRLGGIAAMRPRDGEVLALAGIATATPQPPGSVFKIITLAGALEARVVRAGASFPVETAATLEGVQLVNAHGEACGGTLRASFAASCNSVFAPLGARLGAGRLVAAAERFGFNETPTLVGAAPSTLPPAETMGDDLAVGSTAIGQGKVLATPLQMASVAATIAARGRRARPTLRKGVRGRATRATSARTARIVGQGMRAVVTSGTGAAAALPETRVAGKTGTAELRNSVPREPAPALGAPPADDPTDTDAWFAAYAPYGRPRIALAVLLVAQGAGGETAAPVAREVLASAFADQPAS